MLALPLVLALALGAPLGGPSLALGCAHDKQAQRTDDKELTDLSTRSETFWRAVRWQKLDSASMFIEDDMVRRRWTVESETYEARFRVTDASLIDLKLGPVIEAPTDGRVRLAEVLIRVEWFEMPAQILRRETISQTWYRSAAGWYVDWESGHPMTGEPW